MNSLVVLLSVVAFAVAKPSGVFDAGLLAYSSPIIAAAPSAISSQSRLDIKSSPAVVATQIQPISRTLVAERSYLAAPAFAAPAAYAASAIGAPVAYAAPAAYAASAIAAPVAYAAPTSYAAAPLAVAAPAAVSHQSRFDIKTSPAITSTVVSAPVAYSAPIATAATYAAAPALYSAPLAVAAPAAVSQQSRLDIKSSPAITNTIVSAPLAYNAPIATAAIEPAFVKTAFAAPAIASSTFIKSAALVPATIGAPVVPLDTPEVVAARAAHFEAKAFAEGHLIKKRSVVTTPILRTPVISPYSISPVVSTYSAPIYSVPLTYSAAIATPIVAKAYGVHSL